MSTPEIAGRQKAEAALRESEQRMRAIWETSVEGIITIDERGSIESLNPAASRIFGYSPEEVIGQNVNMLMPSPDREQHDSYLDNYLRTGHAKIIGIGREVVGLRKNGTTFPMDLSVSEVKLGDRRLFTGLVRDITERKRAEAALQDYAQRMRAIFDTAVEGILTIDARGVVESLNPAACRIFGYEPAEVVGRNVRMLMPPPDRDRHDSYLANYLRTGHAKIIGIGREVIGLRKDGTLFPMELSVSEMRIGDQRMFTGLVRDISERRDLERALAAATESERSRIARELHDGLGQQLGGLLFMLNGLHRDLQSAQSPLVEVAGELCQELSTALTQARNLAHELYAVPPGPDGLVEALSSLADRVTSDRGIKCRFLCASDIPVPDQSAASHLYRIAQEAVHNALKHSRADQVELELSQEQGATTLRVRDNGVGFPADLEARGLGLQTMQQRARLVGGHLSVRTVATGGVEVECSVPTALLANPGKAERIN